jgi:hypothetical protein
MTDCTGYASTPLTPFQKPPKLVVSLSFCCLFSLHPCVVHASISSLLVHGVINAMALLNSLPKPWKLRCPSQSMIFISSSLLTILLLVSFIFLLILNRSAFSGSYCPTLAPSLSPASVASPGTYAKSRSHVEPPSVVGIEATAGEAQGCCVRPEVACSMALSGTHTLSTRRSPLGGIACTCSPSHCLIPKPSPPPPRTDR